MIVSEIFILLLIAILCILMKSVAPGVWGLITLQVFPYRARVGLLPLGLIFSYHTNERYL
jgi:hypothetical protein